MSDFDSLYNDTIRGSSDSNYDSNNKELLTQKRGIMHEFFSNKITQIVVVFLG